MRRQHALTQATSGWFCLVRRLFGHYGIIPPGHTSGISNLRIFKLKEELAGRTAPLAVMGG